MKIASFARALALAVLALGTGATQAQDTVDPAELEAARAELQRAREELARASRELAALTGKSASPKIEIRRELIGPDGDRPIVGIVMGRAAGLGEGVRLSAVTPGGPAAQAGLKSGDTITAINGTRLDDRDPVTQARELFDGMTEGDRFVLTVRNPDGRGERDVTVEAARLAQTSIFDYSIAEPMVVINRDAQGFGIEVQDLQNELERVRENLHVRIPEIRFGGTDGMNVWRWGFGWSGLELASINPGLGRYFGVEAGALVLDVDGLEDGDLLAGDVIVAVSGRPVTEPQDAMRELRRFQPGEEVDVEVVRDARPITVRVTAPEQPGNAFFYEFQHRDDHDLPHEEDH